MKGYISFNDLVNEFLVNENYLKVAVNRYRNGNKKSWANIKNPYDARMVLIKIDTIPARTRAKYNIPTAQEYNDEQRYKEYELKQDEQAFKKQCCKEALIDAYRNNWLAYKHSYKKLFEHRLNEKLSKVYAQEQAFWVKLIELSGGNYRATRNTLKPLFEVYVELKKELPFKINMSEYSNFSRRVNEIRKALYYNEDVTKFIVNQTHFNKRSKKTTKFHMAMAMVYLSHPKAYSYRIVADLINHHAEQEKLETISESWVKYIMKTDKKFNSLVEKHRYGKKHYNDTMSSYIPRKVSPFPANLWMIDGTPMQFYCWNENRTRLIRLYLFTVIDVCSRKIVGYDIGLSEDRIMVANALKLAVELEGHLPAEIVSDNFSANKTEEIKELQQQMEDLGTLWRHASVGNAQDKSYVERFYGSFQSVACALYDDYLGEGIRSKRKNARPDKEFLAQVARKKGYAGFKEMKARITKMISYYNEFESSTRKAPLQIHKSLPKPNAVTLDPLKIALLFWKKTSNTIRRSMVVITVRKQKYFYDIKSNLKKLLLHKEKVTVRYDEKDLSRVMLFNSLDDSFICECKQIFETNIASIDRTELDEFETLKQTAKKKSFDEYANRECLNTLEGGLETVGKTIDDFEIEHPLNLDKHQINSVESQQMREHYAISNDMDLDEVEDYKIVKTVPDFIKQKSSMDIQESFTTRKAPRK